MAQHDYNLANASGASFRSDANDALAATVTWNSGATAPATTFARMRWADTTAGVIKRRNAANSAWIVESTDDETRVLPRSSNTMLDVSDIGKTIKATSNFTQTLDAVATLGDGWHCGYIVDSGVTITVDPNSSENIDGATTKSLVGPCSGFIVCNGSALFTIGFDTIVAASDTVAGKIEIAVQSEMEAGSSLVLAVTPGRQHFHPSAVKFWCRFDGSAAGPITPVMDYNVVDVTDNGTGDYTINIETDFSGATWAPMAGITNYTSGNDNQAMIVNVDATDGSAIAAGTLRINTRRNDNVALDPTIVSIGGLGDQA